MPPAGRGVLHEWLGFSPGIHYVWQDCPFSSIEMFVRSMSTLKQECFTFIQPFISENRM